jgi:hypothetical protein
MMLSIGPLFKNWKTPHCSKQDFVSDDTFIS